MLSGHLLKCSSRHFGTDWAVRAVAIPRHALREPSCPVVLFLPRHQPAPCRESRRFPPQLSKPPQHQLWAQLSNAAFLRLPSSVTPRPENLTDHRDPPARRWRCGHRQPRRSYLGATWGTRARRSRCGHPKKHEARGETPRCWRGQTPRCWRRLLENLAGCL